MNALAMLLGFGLALVLQDVLRLPNPVYWMKPYVGKLESRLRHWFPNAFEEERGLGWLLSALIFPAVAAAVYMLAFLLLGTLNTFLWLMASVFMCCWMLSEGFVFADGAKVRKSLQLGDFDGAVEMACNITRADEPPSSESETVELVCNEIAGSTIGKLVAPIFFMAIGGIPLLAFYIAVNTTDYTVERYSGKAQWLRKIISKFNHILYFIPENLFGLLMTFSAFVLGMNSKKCLDAFKNRSYYKSASFALGKAACKAALDSDESFEAQDIERINLLLIFTSVLYFVIVFIIRLIITRR